MDFMNVDKSRSYTTETNLTKSLEKLGLTQYRPMIVRNRVGRYTAIFGKSFLDGRLYLPLQHGFPVLG